MESTSTTSPELSPPESHPCYSHTDADIVLISSDGWRFKIHSLILKLSSDVFAGMITIPKPHTSEAGSASLDNEVQLQEDHDVIKDLLDGVYPRRPRLDLGAQSFGYIMRLAAAADKYDILDVTRDLREEVLRADSKFPGTPLEKYAVASAYGWTAEAQHVSQYCPPPNVKLHKAALSSISTPSLLALMSLHQSRKDIMQRALSISYQPNQPEETRLLHLRWETLGYHGLQGSCRSTNNDKGLWQIFKYHVLSQLEICSPVDAVSKLGERGSLWTESRFQPIWDEECKKCSQNFLHREMVARELARVLGILPMTIDED